MKKIKKINLFNKLILSADKTPLWWVGIVLFLITFFPYLLLKGGSVFNIHDQMDETILTYVLNAKYLGTNITIFPEMLGGVHASGMQPAAILFIPFYKWLPTLTAFLMQYAIIFLAGFFGMYFSVKKLTKSSILALAMAGCFSLLPIDPVYGLSVLGVPLLLYAFLCLFEEKHLIASLLLIVLFGLSTHLLLVGYVVLTFWGIALLKLLLEKKLNHHVILGFLFLISTYIIVNYKLIYEFVIGKPGFISHREEFISQGSPFWGSVKALFLNSAQHVPSLHKYLILPIILLLIIQGFRYKKIDLQEQKKYIRALLVFLLLIFIALMFGCFRSEWMFFLRKNMKGFLRYFQVERYYWVYPTLWYLEFALCYEFWWNNSKKAESEASEKWYASPIIKLVILCIVLFPTIQEIKGSSYFGRNLNQINNGSEVTGYISWESYYAEDLMDEIEKTIGKDLATYKIAHLGVNPSPALMHGFYTVDGYSNNYSLEYKHKMRQVIEKEINKSEEIKKYFDDWGSRCYLFNQVTGIYWNLAKRNDLKYENLDFDMEALKGLGCEYLFSGSEILDATEMGLKYIGYYETDLSYWGIWLYQLDVGST